jgi:hypothetical protein
MRRVMLCSLAAAAVFAIAVGGAVPVDAAKKRNTAAAGGQAPAPSVAGRDRLMTNVLSFEVKAAKKGGKKATAGSRAPSPGVGNGHSWGSHFMWAPPGGQR